MNRTSLVFTYGFVLSLVTACGGATGGGGGETVTGTTDSDVSTYRELATLTQAAVISYRASMVGSDVTPATCQAIHDHYDGQVRPGLSEMIQMAGEMDDFMGAHDGATAADMRCVSAAMMDELDHHRATACTFAELSASQNEAARHSAAMVSYSGHMFDRAGEMMHGLDGGSWSWGSMMGGCQAWYDGGMPHDGFEGGMPHDGFDGGMMPHDAFDGGMPHDGFEDAMHDGGMMHDGGGMGGH